MNILFINSVCGIGSTGRICVNLAEQFIKNGDNVKIAYGRLNYVPKGFEKNTVKIGTNLSIRLHALKTRFTDKHGLGSKIATKKFLRWADKFNPDILWLHNLHGYYINYQLLFRWIKSRPKMQVKWTLHDCWAFTGHCSYFTLSKCNKWQSHCEICPQLTEYPKSMLLDNSFNNFKTKKSSFTGVKNMTLITPSEWLANLVKQSFLCEYPVKVIKNNIDTSVFKPTKSSFRKANKLENVKIVLGVANKWDKRKGLIDFIKLSELLDDRYKIVLVGINGKQAKTVPANIMCLESTRSKEQLAELYSTADVFVNMTYEDNYPTVNLEAQACGTPVFTYETGGCRETVYTEKSRVVKTGDVFGIYDLILKL